MQLLDIIQKDIDRLYGTNTGFKASDFYFDGNDPRAILFIAKDNEDTALLRLLLTKDISDNLQKNNPLNDLNKNNINDFMSAVEEVDHFNYLINWAGIDKEFTELELEIQARITTYLILTKYLYKQGKLRFGDGAKMDGVFDLSFERNSNKNELYRFSYYVGSRFAYKLKKMLEKQDFGPFNKAVRAYYHYGLTDKICCALYRSALCRT